ncbi:hypothetical protein P3T76_003255 [Phytophthora citrophthora]|uniref:RxLR effector protein n=1 Tax=Phytophthora citrophthora TaxID=4793 RepID=A0AAD9LRK2_9STRA|nr:hypothetical protein P3T76_003255 [Phytophthora citrophthora]
MQLTNILLMTAVILFSCSAAAASSPELATVSDVNPVQANIINQRFLRGGKDSEERTVTLPNFAKLDDVVVAKMAGKLFNTEKLKAAIGKTTEASNARNALFNQVNAANPAVRKEFLARLTKSGEYNWLLPYWAGFKLKNRAKVEREVLPDLAKLDDVVVAKLATKLFDREKLKSAMEKTTARDALFKEVNAANPAVRKEFLAKLTKSGEYNWLLPYWDGFKLKSIAKVDADEIKAATRTAN